MKFKISVISGLLTGFIFLGSVYCPAASAQDDELLKMKPDQPIIVDGDKVEYFDKENKIVAEGNVSITYGDVVLKCDKIEVNTKLQKAACYGNVRIEHSEGILTGDHIIYDFPNKKGEIVGAEVTAFPWFAQAEETRRVSANEYILRKGFVTTCDLDDPHYKISAEEIQIFPDDKVIAKNAIFWVGKVPVLWLPYYYHPIVQTRAKVEVIPGSSSEWGYFLLSAWRFYVRGNTKVDLLLDYRTKKGFAEGADLYYYMSDLGLDGLGEGLFRAYFIHQNDWGTYDPTSFRDEGTGPVFRDRYQWIHRVDFDPNTVGMIEFNKYSDEYVIKDYFYNEYEESDPAPQNYASIVTYQENFLFSIEARKRFNRFYTVVEKLPEIKLEIPDQRLWKTPIYYGSTTSATSFTKRHAYDNLRNKHVERFDTFHKISYVAKLGFLNLTPYGTFRETFYSRNKWRSEFIDRWAVGGGLNAFARFHKVYDYQTDFMGMDINGIRHIITPSAEYFHLHQPTVDKDNLYQMDEIDALEKQNGVRLSLENKLQTKRHSGPGGQLESVDLVRFIVGTTYKFRLEKNNFDFQDEGKLEDINFDLELSPYSWFYIDSEMKVNPKNSSIKSGSVEFTMAPTDNFMMDFGYRYEKLHPKSRNQLTFDVDYRLNPKWRFGWYERFNLEGGTIEEQEFSIIRDLHCWEVELSYNVEGTNFIEDDYTVWLAFRIKAFPDMHIGLSRRFDKRPPGTIKRY